MLMNITRRLQRKPHALSPAHQTKLVTHLKMHVAVSVVLLGNLSMLLISFEQHPLHQKSDNVVSFAHSYPSTQFV